jgi:hypothetical protein
LGERIHKVDEHAGQAGRQPHVAQELLGIALRDVATTWIDELEVVQRALPRRQPVRRKTLPVSQCRTDIRETTDEPGIDAIEIDRRSQVAQLAIVG